ncbi:MAG: saccharopine dehydrogenase NADP-binding domain-containing protein [Chloracidobacterium sp.]|nr:saccharopine dehydrogenase NADP-binding domain-containing protein [Chloracidobacterium sp.]
MNFLIYGANGYTGELIVRYAAKRGLKPILAGRNAIAVEALAKKHHLEYRVFSLNETDRLDAALQEVEMVLHCAGPFSLTSRPMVEACIRNKKHYTDITGEIAVFEACAAMGKKAEDAGVMLMPGVGFDVVPSDCLAKHLKDRLPTATHLSLAFYGMGRISHGTQATMTMNVGKGGAIRKDGKITSVPAAWKTREIDFGDGVSSPSVSSPHVSKGSSDVSIPHAVNGPRVVKTAVTIPWGDVATAYYSTGIPNIEVFTVVPKPQLKMLKLSRYLGWLLASKPVNNYLQKQIPPGGPTDEERAKGRTLMWGEASDLNGNRVQSHQQGPEGYTLTALAALNIAEKILAGNFTPGYQTPAKVYGADVVLEIEGVTRQD